MEHGFRLPSAIDNRPLTYEEWEGGVIHQAGVRGPRPHPTRSWSSPGGVVVEQIIRPTGLVDPRGGTCAR